MKKRILPLLLAASLFLSGCTSMLERSDVSATAHVDYSAVTEDSSILRVKNYQDLVNSVLHFAHERARTGTIRLYNYTGDVETDLVNACDEVMHEDPLGAYSLRDITFDTTRILTYYEVEFTFSYSRAPEEVNAIREIAGLDALRRELSAMVDQQKSKITLLVSYFSGNEDLVWQFLTLARLARPELYIEPGNSFSCDISIYPEHGSRRIIEITVDDWGPGRQTTLAELSAYALQMEETADRLLELTPPAGDSYTVQELARILRSTGGSYDFYGAGQALHALTGVPTGHMSYLLAMEYLCQRCGIEVFPVVNRGPGYNVSLIVATEEGYRHLLPQDLLPLLSEEGQPPAEPQPLPLYTDEELVQMGYSWVQGLYPACEAPEEPPHRWNPFSRRSLRRARSPQNKKFKKLKITC